MNDHTYIVSTGNRNQDSDPGAAPVATRITVVGNKVTRMQQFHPAPHRSDQVGSRDVPVTDPPIDDDVAEAAVNAIHAGDVATLQHLLAEHPELARGRITGRDGRTLLHVATDSPGHFPHVAASIRTLAAAGADVNATSIGSRPETPLHWAASSDDVEALDALLDAGAGADIDPPGGGSPLFNATAFGQRRAARRLLDRGAHAGLWEAAVMGLLETVEQQFTDELRPSQEDVDDAFWGACHGGQQATAAFLLDHGANINCVCWDNLTPLQAAQRSEAETLANWLRENGAT